MSCTGKAEFKVFCMLPCFAIASSVGADWRMRVSINLMAEYRLSNSFRQLTKRSYRCSEG